MRLTYIFYIKLKTIFFSADGGKFTERKHVFETLHGVESIFINQI